MTVKIDSEKPLEDNQSEEVGQLTQAISQLSARLMLLAKEGIGDDPEEIPYINMNVDINENTIMEINIRLKDKE